VDATEPTEDERVGFYVRRTMASRGPVKAAEVKGYYPPNYARYKGHTDRIHNIMEDLVEEGEVARFEVPDGKKPYYCLSEDAERLVDLEEGSVAGKAHLLNPFDNSIWDRKRVYNLFGFNAKLEAYTPAKDRKYGYYTLPILYGDRLVGRIVPKMDRKKGVLIVQSTWHEPWFNPDESYWAAFSATMESFATFNGAEKIEFLEKKPRVG